MGWAEIGQKRELTIAKFKGGSISGLVGALFFAKFRSIIRKLDIDSAKTVRNSGATSRATSGRAQIYTTEIVEAREVPL